MIKFLTILKDLLSPERSKQVLGLEHRDPDEEEDEDEDQDAYADEADEAEGYGADEMRFSSGG